MSETKRAIETYIDALQKGTGYDWIANNGHDLSKDELISVIKELLYAIHRNGGRTGEEKRTVDYAVDELVQQYLDD